MESAKFFVRGEWRSAERTRPVVNPYHQRRVGEVCQASAEDIQDATQAAQEAFRETRKLSSDSRAGILAYISHEIRSQREALARLLSDETGKPISAARLEVERAVFTFEIASEEAKRIEGEVIPLDLAPNSAGRTGIVKRFPLGPIAAITPFNFPLNLVAHKVGPAIAAGNTVVLKPSSSAPLTALALAAIVEKSELPKGAFNVVPCLGDEANQLVENERIKLVSFTGSPDVGWRLKYRAGKKRTVLELGGNAGVIIDRDASLEYALPRLIWGSYGVAGQSCISVQRIFVQKGLYLAFLDRFVELSHNVPTGDPANEKTVVGPMITESAAAQVEEWIREAVKGGATLRCGGQREGAVLHPTVLTDVKPSMSVCAREVFAPLVTVVPFDDFEEAVALVNDSRYGLQAGVFTNSLSNTMFAFEHLEVGGVIINDVPTYRMDHMPYGGVKDSGFGREGVRYAIEEMTEMKLLALNPVA